MLLILTLFASHTIADEYSILAGIKKVNIFASITSRTNYNDSVLHEPVQTRFGCEDIAVERGYYYTTTNIENSCGTTERSIQLQSYSVEDEKWYDYSYHTTHNFCIYDYRSWPLWERSVETGIHTESGGDISQSSDWQRSSDISTEWTYGIELHQEMGGDLKSAILTGEFWFSPVGVYMVNGLMPSIKNVQCPAPYELTQPCGACFRSTYSYSIGMCQGTMEWDLTSQVLSSDREIRIRFEGSGDPLILQDIRDCGNDNPPNRREEKRGASISARESPFLILTYRVEGCEINVRVSPSEVWPQKTGSKETTATVMVSLTSPPPPEGCTVNLMVEPVEKSGGHIHTSGRNDHKGTLTTYTMHFDAEGAQNTKYWSSEVSGEEKIIAKVKGEKKGEAKVTVMVPGLEPLGSSIVYNLSQSPDAAITHPKNHYGVPDTNDKIFNVAFEYLYETDAILGINDMSLEKGGLFDIDADWLPPHSSHRVGKSVDINRTAQDTETLKYVNVDRERLNRIAARHGGVKVKEPTIHYEFP